MRLLSGKSYSWSNPGLKRTQIDIFKKFVVKTTFKLIINIIQESFALQIYPMKPSAGLSNLVKLFL
jgi:hypothetical protein